MSYLLPSRRMQHALGAFDWSSVTNAALQQASEAAATTPAVQVNRARVAATAHAGYSAIDTYTQAKPWIFVASVLGALASGYGVAKRRKVPEAVTLYSMTGVASLAMAWLTRPDYLGATEPTPPAASTTSPSAFRSSLAWADARAARLSHEQPGWERATLARLWGDLGTGTMVPAVDTLISKNSH